MTMLWPTTAQPATQQEKPPNQKTELKIVAPERHLRL